MVFVDSICVFLCIANVIMHFRRLVDFINLWLNSVQTAAGIIIMWFILWQSVFFGLCYFNMALYGNQDIKYKDLYNATIYTFYSPIILQYNETTSLYSTIDGSFMMVFNQILWYFILTVWFMAPYMAVAVREHIFCEVTNFEPAVDKDGNFVTSEELPPKEQAKASGIKFLLWFVSWLPEKNVYKIKLNLEGDESL